MSYEHVIVERTGAIGRLTLNRPEKLNAFAGRMRDEILEGLTELDTTETRVVVITGAGRGFCSGADVGYLSQLLESRDAASFEKLLVAGRDVVTKIRELPFPVVASVNGPAAGGGLNLALACDIRLASDRATFGQTFTRIGLAPDWGGVHFLPRLVGESKALELMMTGDIVTADEALRIGLVNRLVKHDELAAETDALAALLASRPPASVRAIKAGIYASASRTLGETLEFEMAAQLECFATNDAREGVAAFFAKRSPSFTGT